MFSRSLGHSLMQVFDEARVRQHQLVTLEHLLLALLDNSEACQAIKACGANVDRLRVGLNIYLDETTPNKQKAYATDIEPTMSFQRVLHRAILKAQDAGYNDINGVNVLCGIFAEQESQAVYFLSQESVTRIGVETYLADTENRRMSLDDVAGTRVYRDHSNQFNTADEFNLDRNGLMGSESGEPLQADIIEEGSKEKTLIETYTTNLNKIALAGTMDPVIGRENEIRRGLQILCRRSKNNPLFLGEPGVGKTALANGIAQLLVNDKVPKALQGNTIYALDMGVMLAGTKYRGDFEKRFKAVLSALSKKSKAIIFIDEIHNLVGAGAATGGTIDAANLIKPLLSSGEVRCIGATTYAEYRNHFGKDAALVRRFQNIDLTEPSAVEAVAILKGIQGKIESFHKVKYTDDAINAAVKLGVRHLTDRRLPDKAIDIIDEAGAYQQLNSDNESVSQVVIDAVDIRKIVAGMARIPVQNVNGSDRKLLQQLASKLKHVVFGQDKAIERLTQAIKLSRSGLRDPGKPIGSFLFPGPTGVGKTELTRQLAKHLGVELLRFDMSEYMERHAVSRLIGAPPGYVGYDQGGLLTEKVNKHPYSVLLLDEIEKAHPDMFNLLLQIMDHGTLTDNNGRAADFKHVTIVMTTNAGADLMEKSQVGFMNRSSEADCMPAIEKIFTPEFRNRLDAIIPFSYLTPHVVHKIVKKIVGELSDSLGGKGVDLSVHADVCTWLVEHGYCRDMGARPMSRLIEQKLKQPLADEILFGKLRQSGVVKIEMRRNKIHLKVTD